MSSDVVHAAPEEQKGKKRRTQYNTCSHTTHGAGGRKQNERHFYLERFFQA